MASTTEKTSSTSTDHPRTLVRLPLEITDKIFSQLNISDLASIAQVCRSFHQQASPHLYRNISHTFYPGSAMDDFFSWQLFDSIMKPLMTSTHHYAQHVREISVNSIDGSEVLGSPINGSRSPLSFHKYLQRLNAFLVQLLYKAEGLVTFRWDINVELSPSLLLALNRLGNLQSLYLRLPPAVPMSRPAYATSFSEVLGLDTPSMPPTSRHTLPQVSGLKSLTLLDIPSLDSIADVAKCISSSSSTLKTLQLSFADTLALKKSKILRPYAGPAHNPHDDHFDFDDIFGPLSEDEEPIYIPVEPKTSPEIQDQFTAQEEASALLFGLGLPVPTAEETRVTTTGNKSLPHLISRLTIHDSGSSSTVRVDTAVSIGGSSVSSAAPVSLGASAPSNAPTSMSSISETSVVCAQVDAKSVKEYVREAHGLPVEGLYLYQIPLTANTFTGGVDLSSIRHLSLLNVGPQDHIWEAMNQRHSYTPYNLTSIHTDNVVESFLEFVHNLPRLSELFILERRHPSKLINTPCTTVSITDIRRFILDKHHPHLERLVMRHDENSAWILDRTTATLLTSAPKLTELAVSLDFTSYSFIIRNIMNMKSLRALQVFWHHKIPDTVALRREVAFLADRILCYPELAIEYVGMGYIRAGPITNCIVHVPARGAQLRELKASRESNYEASIRHIEGGSRFAWDNTPLATVPTVPDEVLARSAAAGFDADEIVGVKMWEPRTWNLKL